jgi:hypothetical protein
VRPEEEHTVRKLGISYYSYGSEEQDGPAALVVRYPDDLKRERVEFLLEAIDLF